MILNEIKSIRKSKGLTKAQEDAYAWYKSAKKNPYDGSVEFVNDQMLQVGKINVFKYNPKGKDKLDYYDKNPVVISLGTFRKNNRIYEMGINLNFIPAPYKWYVLDKIQNIYSGFFIRNKTGKTPIGALKQPQIKYSYNALKTLLDSFGFKFALRVYIPSRKSNVYCIDYNSWINSAFLSIDKFEGITYNQMISEFSKNK